ncbi:ABC transporter permease [Avibacterium endocarditidis]|uniref:ABC transporter permease n=1 Tax=Avibacterium endocarditidis TaxID=380674 RepID=UPI003BF7F585
MDNSAKHKNFLAKSTALIALLAVLGFFLLPIIALLLSAFEGSLHSLQHLWQTVFTDYLFNSLSLVFGTTALSLCFALPCAFLVSRYHFVGKTLLQWLLCLPLAIPAYLSAYLYTDFLDYPGIVQQSLRTWFDWQSKQDYWFPSIRSLGGACFILALSLYPYIFLLVRMALMEQGDNLQQSAKLLGASRWRVFYKITFALIRPAIAVGCALVAMETLGDFGTVAFFAIPSLTTAIYDTWLGFGDLQAAAQISLFMLGLLVLFISIERYARRQQRYYQRSGQRPAQTQRLNGLGWSLLLFSTLLIILAFFIPLFQLSYWSIIYFEQTWTADFWQYSQNSLLVSGLAMIICVCLALLMHFWARLRPTPLAKIAVRFSALGYAIPGTVLAIGLLIPFTFADHQLNRLLKWLDLSMLGLVFSGSIFALVSAYVIRFSAMALGSLETSLSQIPPSLDMAGRMLGYKSWGIWRKIHLPLMRKGIFTALLLVFIESMKELNASLLLRPFNFDTLATHVFTFTSDEQLERAALPALVLILVGIIPVLILTRSLLQSGKKA